MERVILFGERVKRVKILFTIKAILYRNFVLKTDKNAFCGNQTKIKRKWYEFETVFFKSLRRLK